MEVEKKLSKLREIIAKLDSVVVAFSGGVDSTLVTKVCYDVLKDNAMAVTARSETYPDLEFKEAQKLAKEIGIKHLVIDTSELAIEGFANNPPERCYFCKTELFGKLKDIAREQGFLNVADGANLDDTKEFRPGLQASKELNVRSPLKEAGLAKGDIREVSKMLNLPNWNKPAYACLSSRFPYGQSITEEKLSMVSEAEKYLRGLGLIQFRVRHHETIARIEVLPEDIQILTTTPVREELTAKFKEIGFTYVTMDLAGYRSGSMNEVLSQNVVSNLQ
ncbi:MAG: ATP-dependent sacrificial sulfur transferase LarE [Candidatus Scalindua sp.]|nr:ATP-dependent sacrificial sulfur transferase LarE [Candidatus Scalindua sp.]MBT5306945.1 ATP-dependent sacrificial sulfur transferase LarE [Candidatus Scalindua sp.]MBT6053217.1 ATP-dependent sacrificial sulfur transferase LarE [Candidatus Scalindua sp.]MBT6225439.1 ATP-dependent sacrificial sulfur transferase LarE [Candidatus Scalindua sp.]MBT6562851.1 ATP-dependent sacrificial sulfur transferase LarE [Candidatus Scalindua sp.]